MPPPGPPRLPWLAACGRVFGRHKVLLYEHVRPHGRLLGKLTDLLSPLTRRLFGPELNRPTEDHVEAAGLHITEIRRHGIWREIVATPVRPAPAEVMPMMLDESLAREGAG